MDSIGALVLIVATAAIGLAAIIAGVQLWRHQPVHDDQRQARVAPQGAPDASASPREPTDDEATVDFGADEATRNLAEIEQTVDLGRKHKQD